MCFSHKEQSQFKFLKLKFQNGHHFFIFEAIRKLYLHENEQNHIRNHLFHYSLRSYVNFNVFENQMADISLFLNLYENRNNMKRAEYHTMSIFIKKLYM